MSLSIDLISKFAKLTKEPKKTSTESTHYATTVEYNGSIYVKIDGSDMLTPISKTADVKPDERVTVTIKDHSATVTGNLSSPSARSEDVKNLDDKVTEFYSIVADKVTTEQLEAQVGRIDELVSDNVTIKEQLKASDAEIEELQADNVTIKENLKAANADIENLEATKLSADIADLKYAAIDDLDATNAKVNNLEATYGEFKVLTTEKFDATDASIKNLETNKLSAKDIEGKYANIDFSNIQQAAIEKVFSESGIIKDLIVSEGKITGELVGVTIKGDLIEGGTVIADKLVIKGDNGLYYKLNTDGVKTETEQTDYNSLNGSIITAKSITATKISVDDLVAFGATIGGFNITENSIYSGVKESATNTTRGIYLDKEGQVAFGDGTNFLRYYKDQNGNYKLEVSASSIMFSSSEKNLEDTINDIEANAIVSSIEQFYKSTSSIALTGGEWSTEQPEWTDGTYIWRRNAVTYGDGRSEYTPSSSGVCITGNTGEKGDNGKDGQDSVLLYIDSSNGTVFKNNSVSTVLSVTIYYGSKRITDIETLRNEFGESSHLQWKWKLPEDEDYVDVASDDYRISGSGFAFTISPDDVAIRATFICDLII